MSGCCVMALRLQSGKEECEVSNRGEKESDEERNRREMRFLRLWGACQPSLFPEWEREMDLREAEEERRRQEEAHPTTRAFSLRGAWRETPRGLPSRSLGICPLNS